MRWREADVVVAIGTRLQDFTTGSGRCSATPTRLIAINAARFDANKHRALAVVADAREALAELDAALGATARRRRGATRQSRSTPPGTVPSTS
jgi:TPP-dependent trihydroxycyclohexane-1,2-dione (THcHDO) dehydratase